MKFFGEVLKFNTHYRISSTTVVTSYLPKTNFWLRPCPQPPPTGKSNTGVWCSYRGQVVQRLVTRIQRCSQQYIGTCHCQQLARRSAAVIRYETLRSEHLTAGSLDRSFPNVLAASADRWCRTTAACASWRLLPRPSPRLQYLAVLNNIGKTHNNFYHNNKSIKKFYQ